jgi:hypothetical protein
MTYKDIISSPSFMRPIPPSLRCVALFVLCFQPCRAAWDEPGEPAYADGWQTGDAGGAGWQSGWYLYKLDEDELGIVTLPFEGSPTPFWLCRAGPDLGEALAERLLADPFATGSSITLRFGHGPLDPTMASVGFGLRDWANPSTPGLFFGAVSGSTSYLLELGGSVHDTGIALSEERFSVRLDWIDAATFRLRTSLNGGTDESFAGSLEIEPQLLHLFADDDGFTGGGQIGYFGAVEIVPEPSTGALAAVAILMLSRGRNARRPTPRHPRRMGCGALRAPQS